jgi:hypothetical protein
MRPFPRAKFGVALGFSLLSLFAARAATPPSTQAAPSYLSVKGKRLAMYTSFRSELLRHLAATVLSGTIVDLDGKPIDVAQVHISQRYSDALYPKFYKAPEETTLVANDGRFSTTINLLTHIAADLNAHKDGYYDQNVTILPETESNSFEDALADAFERGYLDYDPAPDRGLIIHLRKKGTLTTLKPLFGEAEQPVRLVITSHGDMVVADPRRPSPTFQIKAADAVQLGTGIYRLVADRDDDHFRLLHHERVDFVSEAYDEPTGLRLTADDPSIQFQWAHLEDPKYPLLSLTSAPVDGYSSVLDFADRPNEIVPSGRWFYCKINDSFGRGAIAGTLARDKSHIWMRLQIWLQPDGSRNLETGQER